MCEIYFSMIVYVDSDELLKRCIRGIMSTSHERIKLIVADGVCSAESMEMCQKWQEQYGEKKFVYIRTYGMSLAEAYNTAIPEIAGRYVNFSLASMQFAGAAMQAVYETAEELGRPKLLSLSPWTVNEKGEYLQYVMSPKGSTGAGYDQVSLNQNPERLNLFFHSYFIRCYLIRSRERNMWFRSELQEDAMMEMLLNLLAEIRNYVYLPRVKVYYSQQMEDNTSAFSCQHCEWWYSDSLRGWMIPFAEKWDRLDYPLRVSMRIALYYLVYARFNCNYNNRDKSVLQGEKISEFFSLAGQLFQYIDNSLLFQKNIFQNFVTPRGMRMLFLRLKAAAAGNEGETVVYGNKLLLWTHGRGMDLTEQTLRSLDSKFAPDAGDIAKVNKILDHTRTLFTVNRDTPGEKHIPEIKYAYEYDVLLSLCEIPKEHVILQVINYQNGKLEIDGMLSLGNFLKKDQIRLKVIKAGKEYPAEYSEVYGLDKVFGVTFEHKYMFHTSVPVSALDKKSEFQFALELNGLTTILEIRTQTVYAHVRTDIKGQYWRFADEWCLSISGKNKLVITLVAETDVLRMERVFQKELEERILKGNVLAEKALRLRRMYFERKKNPIPRIWITYDKLYKAGDNGEYLFHYIAAQDSNIEIRYLIQKNVSDYVRLKKDGVEPLVWGEEETLVTVLLAEAILITHADVFSFTGFEKGLLPYICDLFNPVNICIQHGLTVQNIANFQNRLLDNIQLYLCASQNEIENLSRPIYGYRDKSALRLTGVARYDGLKSTDQHQILITPTWRRSLALASKMGSKRGHSDSFRDSEYFKIYNGLINDPRLIMCAKKTGYKIVYLLHPVLSAQINDFDRNDYVQIVAAADNADYEKLLTESSLMVTDYSGVQFDFAYMRKPILYYHPETLPPHFDESKAYVYETMAFGPLIHNYEEIVGELCSYMKSGCIMKPEYVERADRFFAFQDFDNCQRIYKEVLSFLEEHKESM